ncbi:MAG: nucleotidyl transferase AbiEii/AbiGii toxin family protein [Chitinivibrionales bacterium]|nr:nucleotidyl transferase AbiEii/AbiGii toxin family protein [Chitinivibrionales bacterium]
MPPRVYASASAFRTAVETRLMQLVAKEGQEIMRLRRQFTFDRFLCRVFHDKKDMVMLKGGYAIELRVAEARTTKNIDLCMKKVRGATPSPEELHSFFQEKAVLQLGDFMIFKVFPPSRLLVNAVYGGRRFTVDASMAGRLFTKFSIDVSIGDGWIDDQDSLQGRDWLAFAGVPPLGFPATTIEQQLAEKIHSYSLPRQKPNSRVKDLVDIVLLTRNFNINKERMVESLKRTFKLRKTHSIPDKLSPPPAAWGKTFLELANESELKLDLDGAFTHLKDFYENSAK